MLSTITVNTTTDSIHFSSTATASQLSGTISLRDAVEAATNTAGATTIVLPAGTYDLLHATVFPSGQSAAVDEVPAGTDELIVGNQSNQSITIQAANGAAAGSVVIDQTVAGYRIFDADPTQYGNIALNLSNVTLEGATDVGELFGGGAILAGGPAVNGSFDSLTLTNCLVQNNSTSNENGGAINYGGGGNLTVTGSTFTNNVANGTATNGAGGGAISYDNDEPGILTISNSTFTHDGITGTGPDSQGGAVSFAGAGGSITGSTFTGNNAGPADGRGGALEVDGSTSTTFTISGDTFTSNAAGSASGNGGALVIENDGTTNVSDSTFVGNAGGSGSTIGGAIETFGGTIGITTSRFHGNTAPSGTAIGVDGGTVTAGNDWWGADAFPDASGTDSVAVEAGSLSIPTRLALALAPSSSKIATNASTTLTAEIVSATTSSTGTTPITGTALEGLALTFAPGTLGSVSPTSATISNGVATSTFASGTSFGTTSPSVTLDNGTKTTSVTIIGPPTANAHSYNVAHDSSGLPITLTGTDTNSPPLALSNYTITTAPTHGTLSGTAPNVTYTPTPGYHGSDSFQFTVYNGTSTSAPGTISLTVAVGTPTATAQSVGVAHNTATAVTLKSTDDDTPTLTPNYIVTTNPAHGTLSGTGANLTYTPNPGYNGTDSFQYTAGNGTNTSTAATITLTVAAGVPTATAQSVSVAHDTATAVTLKSTDDDNPTLPPSYFVTVSPSHGTLSGSGANLTYTPTAGYDGTDSFQFTANNGTNTSSPATVTLNVAAGVPTANAQPVSVAHDTATAVTLKGTDPDVPALSLTYALATSPAHGTLSGTAPNLTYTPNAGYHGSDSFQFTVSNGTNTSSAATVSLTVAVGTPAANSQSFGLASNTPTAIMLSSTDDDNPALTPSYVVTVNPSHGTLSGTAPNLTYTPNAGYSGTDSFQFTASNGTNTSSPATISLNVAPPSTATVSGNVGVSWGTSGTATLLTAADGLRLLPSGRFTDIDWLGISKLTITLSQAEPLSASDVSVTGVNVANYGPVTISGSGTTYTLTLAQPINAADKVTVTVGNANVTTFTRRLDVLPGDFNDDGVVNGTDATLVRNEYLGLAGGVPNTFGDINGDGTVDVNDYNTIRRLLGTKLP